MKKIKFKNKKNIFLKLTSFKENWNGVIDPISDTLHIM